MKYKILGVVKEFRIDFDIISRSNTIVASQTGFEIVEGEDTETKLWGLKTV